MSESMIQSQMAKRPRTLACKCFFFNDGSCEAPYTLPLHSHRFWQLELGIRGRIQVRLDRGDTELLAGVALFIPPGTRHGFSYAPGIRYASFKFHADFGDMNPKLIHLRESPLLAALERALLAMINSNQSRDDALGDALLTAMFAVAYRSEERVPGDSLLARLRHYVQKQRGRYVTVTEAAEYVGYSVSHLSALFRNETGEAIKTFLDRERGRHAAELVLYSDLSFGQIAYEMGFPDAFAFSRFFKRIHGKSPRAFRRNAQTTSARAEDE